MQSNDFWLDYFEENPLADDLADDIRLSGADSRFSRPDWHLLMTPVIYPEKSVKKQTKILHELFNLIRNLHNIAFDGEMEAFANALGFSDERVISLMEQLRDVNGIIPCRWDILDDGNHWKVMEVNVGGAIGGFAYDGIQALYDQALENEKDEDSAIKINEFWQSPYSHICPAVAQKLASLNNPKLVVVDDFIQFKDSPLVANSAAGALSTHLDIEVSVIPHNELQNVLASHTGDIAVFEVFTLSDIAKDLDGYSGYLSGLNSGKIHSIIPPFSELYMSKAALAILHQDDVLASVSEQERQLIEVSVPKTYAVGESNLSQLLTLNKKDWVLKSAIGYGGHGVTCGWECDQDTWHQILSDAASPNSPLFILQKRVVGKRHPAISMTPKGVFVESDEAMVLGVFMLNDLFGGGCVRQSLSGKGVICTANHAALGVMRVQGD
ncbi:conserved hypothetical protein [Vibrio nigripulchritudo SO65]|uniref:hypothetical protein n=1 Tax=Vibrio nigripulchritudo TaxID=28173 RepID=UPI0003B18BCD|nr:hypothetical protein [Vibrio nigripulchritudo]CCN34610.1 conserved hypothetical protein [Vibrio nigripulchritudo AM115]CCN40578.1 conserved hypothetical protein [Vibrio nigripulchritudo FTn2]CCN66128.1 conserved hypothetical protein [Vibrio nigripulchritudo POn4]CCN78618.1 conserved hypothetical protein [Vibrio nigripulchritudo SO65]